MDKKRISKIYKKIDSIAKKGELGRNEYYKYVDTLLNSGFYSIFQDVLDRKYKIDTINMSSVDNVKKKTFNAIRFLTNTKIQEDISLLYERFEIYQVGSNIYNSSGVRIGKILQHDSILEVSKVDLSSVKLDSGTLLSKYQSAIEFLLQ